jgi:tRNA pseudouridine13 synthase
MQLSDDRLQLLLSPPLLTQSLPGIGGKLRAVSDDFIVDEIPAYTADDREHAHILLRLHKRDMNTEDAVRILARSLDVARRDIGIAGLKDKFAVTSQWITVPWSARGALDSFEHGQIRLDSASPHGNKLRRGHLHGNRFEIVLRELECPAATAVERIEAKLEILRAAGGWWNLYGEQRFGYDGQNLAPALSLLADGRVGRRDAFRLSVAQAAAFNLYQFSRHEAGEMRVVLDGDILQRVESGGIFDCEEPEVDQARVDEGELRITGPIFGSKGRRPREDSPSGLLEAQILNELGIEEERLRSLGKNAPGARRPLQLALPDLKASIVEPLEAQQLGEGIRLCFALPSGSYATQFLAEFRGASAAAE